MKIQPKHEHDCKVCTFVTSTIWDEVLDWYVCDRPDSPMGGSVIARYSSEGSNYHSWPISMIDQSEIRTCNSKDLNFIGESLMHLMAKQILFRYRQMKEATPVKLYNHAYTIAFSVETPDPTGENTTSVQFRAALQQRMADLDRHRQWHEAIGAPFDTFQVQT